jgi:hypothetical protein
MNSFVQTKSAKITFFLLGLIAVLSMVFIVFSNSKITATLKAPRIVLEEDFHDFGKVPQGPQLQYNFEFVNKGNALLKIEKVQTSCGCTGATVGDKTEYDKNEKGELKVTFNTQGRTGVQEKNIILFTNDPDNNQVVLKIRCDIDPNMEY